MMKNLKPSVFVILGLVWPFAATFIVMGLAFMAPNLPTDLVMPILESVMEAPTPILLALALMLSRAQKDDFAKGRLLKYISPAQICMFGAILTFFVAMIFDTFGNRAFSDFCIIPFVLLSVATVVLFMIRVIQNIIQRRKQVESVPMHRQAVNYSGINRPIESRKEIVYRVKCSMCGESYPQSDMHLVDGKNLCHSCFQKSFPADCEKENINGFLAIAVETLRKEIIDEITKNPATKYQLSSLLFQDAANCFPTGYSFQWDGAWFKLNLLTRKLLAEVSTYPNQFGASREDVYSLSAQEFNRIAKQYNMRSELQAFQTEEDWDKLFDDTLIAAVSGASTTLQKQNENRKIEETMQYAVRIPLSYGNLSPDMDITEVDIELMQRYGNRSVKIQKENEKYKIACENYSNLSRRYDKQFSRELSLPEAVWLEKEIVNTLNNHDNSTWHSLPGGDRMHIVIKLEDGESVSLRDVEPINKYSDLMHKLENLAQYGSVSDM